MPDTIDLRKHSSQIKAKAKSLGFVACGFSEASHLSEYDDILDQWVKDGKHAGMKYFEQNKEKRTDPTKLVEGAVSVISLLHPYYPQKTIPEHAPRIAKYAYGKDYHAVLKKKMAELFDYISSINKTAEGRFFVDSAPFLDKIWAQRGGLGWLGKNSLLINKEMGSFFFIGEIILNAALEYDKAYDKDHCGNCKKCIDACPTSAITANRTIDSNKCISYLNKDHQGEISAQLTSKFSGWVFGCDICQDVCPWNKKPIISNNDSFAPNPLLFALSEEEWKNIDKPTFNKTFKGTAIKRMKFSKFIENINLWKKD